MGTISPVAEPTTMDTELISARLELARELPPDVVLRRGAGMVARRLRSIRGRRRDRARTTFAADAPVGALPIVCDAVAPALVVPHRRWVERAAALFRDHRFDLLGSGWMRIAHGCACPGLGGVRYAPKSAVAPDPEGRWLDARINESNVSEVRRIWRLVDADYTPIDWQLDFRSGYRWREDTWSQDIEFGRLDGVDVKLPWELARMQHLIVLAWAHSTEGASDRALLEREFRNQVLDFVATNPPRFGANWRCTMDVAIRAANWVVTYSLFRAGGAEFDAAFEDTLKRSLVDHGRHIVTHLEIYPEGRANHYLADVAGLMFVAAGLPASPEADGPL